MFQVARNCIAGQEDCNPSFPCHGAAHCVPRVYPRLLGGLGNQLFIMSAAAIIADNLGGVVLLNSKQTGVYSSGAAQPGLVVEQRRSPGASESSGQGADARLGWPRAELSAR